MNPGRRTALRWTVRLLGPCVLAAAALVMPAGGAGATTFTPSWNITVSDPTPGAGSPLVFDLNLPAPSSQFSTLVSFLPPQFAVTNGDQVANGAISGHISAVATLGLVNGACESTIVVGFDLMDASTDLEQTIYLYDGVYDYDGDTLPDNVDRYPNTLAVLAPNVVPIQRLYGQIPVAGILVPLNLIIFSPGAEIPGLPVLDASLGYPILTLLGDPLALPYPNAPISDFCTPLTATTTLEGVSKNNTGTPVDEAGTVLRTNPAQAGSFNSIIFARSQWDADNDGIENSLDPCPLTPDPGWNPRSSASNQGDTDQDGLPNSCDASPTVSNTDQDGDAFSNRLDLCPTVASQYYQKDKDRDFIGDECDPMPDDPSNGGAAHRHQVCVSDAFTIGGSVSAPPAFTCPSGPDLQVPPRLQLFPSESVQANGLVQTLSAFAYRLGGLDPAVAATVSFQITGANPTTTSCLTSNYGYCEANFQGTSNGLDTVVASATIDGRTVSDTGTVLWVGQPSNDNFASPIAAAALPFDDEQYPIVATEEAGEPRPCGGHLNGSVWYSFTPSQDVLLTAEVESNAGPMILAAYTGNSLASAALLQCDATYPDANPPPGATPISAEPYHYEEYLAFMAKAGVTYHFQVGAQFGYYGYPEVKFSIHQSVMGDVNCSGTLNSVDALGVLRTSAGLTKPPCAGNGDVNCNGFVNATDALLILRASTGLIPKPTACPV